MSSSHKRGFEIDRKSKGKRGEELAAKWLVAQGHEIIERNYQARQLEIDIISMLDNMLLVFTEVKWRTSGQYGHPEEFVSEHQQSRIIAAAEVYIHAINWTGDIRFDIIGLGPRAGDLRHFPDAFY